MNSTRRAALAAVVALTASAALSGCQQSPVPSDPPLKYTLEVTGSGTADVSIVSGAGISKADGTALPYSVTKTYGSLASVSLLASSAGGDVTCTITDNDSGSVVDTQTGTSVTCSN